MLNRSYNNHWNKYLKTDHHALNIYIQNVPEEYKHNIKEALYNDALERNLFISRKDVALNDKGMFSGYTFGVYGDVEKNQVSLEFYGRNIIDKDMLKKLILSKEDESTLGIDKGSIHSVGEISSFRFGEKRFLKS